MKILITLLSLVFTALCADYGYIQLNAKSEYEFRAVGVETCPKISCDGQALQTNKRFSEDFTVCFANVNNCKKVTYNKIDFEIKPKIETIAIVGDTGCRVKIKADGKGEIQNCNDVNAWPAKKIADAIVAHNPDIVIHVGDYHYREQCDNKEICDKFSITKQDLGYGYNIWEKDFFEPYANLLTKAPFIFARGNHENCNRAWKVYKAALSPYPYASCKAVDNGWTLSLNATEAPYKVLLSDFSAMILDTAGDDVEAGYNRENFFYYIKTFEDNNFSGQIMVAHQPFYNLNFKEATSRRNALEYTKTKPLFIASGDLHIFEFMRGQKVTQIISGGGGSSLYDLKEFTDGFLEAKQIHNFGFVILKKQGNIYKGSFYSADNEKLYDFEVLAK